MALSSRRSWASEEKVGSYSTLTKWWSQVDPRVGEKIPAAGLGPILDNFWCAQVKIP
uniref:Uncharacterized protein n=1 Tax=Fagus sylvatica TaxID=28930 RepID=A0A2N9IQ81_FAGSY